MPLQLEPLDPLIGLDALEATAATGDGQPKQLPIHAIDEDPDQPRSEFDGDALQQLADTIAQRGVRQPISVRPHPKEPGRWMLNFGARRLRASKLAGKTEVPAFVDPMADTYDQVIENEQRESLKSLELALFVQRQMRKGDSQAEIARRLGKTRGYVTFLCALIDAPDWLLDLYRSNRCRGITELYELRKLHEASPESVERWLAVQDHVGRTEVLALKKELKQVDSTPPKHTPVSPTPTPEPVSDLGRSIAAPAVASVIRTGATRANAATPRAASQSIRSLPGSLTLWARHDGAEVTIELGAIPEEAGCVFVRKSHGTDRIVVLASSVRLLRLTKA
jgi:ParB family chromosome partitioning protein